MSDIAADVDEYQSTVNWCNNVLQGNNDAPCFRRPKFNIFSFLGDTILMGVISFVPILLIIAFGIALFSANDENPVLSSLIPSGIVTIIFSSIHSFTKNYTDKMTEWNDEMSKVKNKKQEAEKYLSNALKKQSSARYELQCVEAQAGILGNQIADLRSKRMAIKNNLNNLYAMNVIKSRYQNIECELIMDELFRDGRVDNMREAMDKCDERIFRNDMLKGMNNLQSMLGTLTLGIMEVSEKLSSIDSNVKMMSQDLYTFSERIAQNQAKQQKATVELLEETKMSRYATEQLAESAKNLEYFERRRNGWA